MIFMHASEVLTGAGIRAKRGKRVNEEDLGRIEDGAVAVEAGRVLWVGRTKDLPKKFSKFKKRNLQNRNALLPGLVDCHTHLVFAGDRAAEFAARCSGTSYQEIAAQGGGIQTTVNATRAATAKELTRLSQERAEEAYDFGTRVLEIKSGYGLSLESETKMLRVAKALKHSEMRFTRTFLGAHAIPAGIQHDEYVRLITQKMLPQIARNKLADSCDVFVDEGYFTVADAKEILGRAQQLGLKVKVHADEMTNTESAAMAVEMGALSADHLLKISARGIHAIAGSETVAVLLPGTAYSLKTPQAPARELLEAGACVALATDYNPGTCMCLSLPFVMNCAALYLEMTRAEIFSAVTYGAAKALGLSDQYGTIEPGKPACITVAPFGRFEQMYYRLAWRPPTR